MMLFKNLEKDGDEISISFVDDNNVTLGKCITLTQGMPAGEVAMKLRMLVKAIENSLT